MATVKTLAVAAALIAGATSLALAQNGPPTGGEPPVAGGGAGNPIVDQGGAGTMGNMGTMGTMGTMGKHGTNGKAAHHKTMKNESKPQ